jgi:hypothetical protein
LTDVEAFREPEFETLFSVIDHHAGRLHNAIFPVGGKVQLRNEPLKVTTLSIREAGLLCESDKYSKKKRIWSSKTE